jgi:DNA polymerase IV
VDRQTTYRKIIHIDMDAFYASVEQRDNPEYRGKAIVVGGRPEGRGGVVATASYEARKFGIRSAMPSKRALELCPEVIFIRPRFDAYKEASQKIREIFSRYTDLIEPLSLDEAYLDVTHDKQSIGSAIKIAQEIRAAISEELRLTASAGVSINKFVAKVASDINKPDGLTFIAPQDVAAFMEQLPVERFHGVGKVTAAKMKNMGLHTGADLKRLTEEEMQRLFGKPGSFYYRIVRGIDEREVQPHRETRSVGAEDTFPEDLIQAVAMHAELEKIAEVVCQRLKKHNLKGRTVTLKIKYSDFRQITRNQSYLQPVDDKDIILDSAIRLLAHTQPDGKRVRLLGITVSNFGDAPEPQAKRRKPRQPELFDDHSLE